MDTKVCSKCGEELPATEEFFAIRKGAKDGFRCECKVCRRIMVMRYVFLNRTLINKKAREKHHRFKESNNIRRIEYSKKNREKTRATQLQRDFGVTEDFIRALMDNQNGCCAICGDSLVYPHSKKSFAVDHDHKTGKVRGLLCGYCNTGLGYFKDNWEYLIEASNYLRTN